MKRAIHLFPDLSHCPLIDQLRQEFDGLFGLIPAHLTLVYPFDLPMPDQEIMNHCQEVAADTPPFPLFLQRPERSADDHYWLPVEPHAELMRLVQRLYGRSLSPLPAPRAGVPIHLTVARPPLPDRVHSVMRAYAREFPVKIHLQEMVLERIHPDQSSQLLGVFPFRG